jgi:outer membrane PBP1 activator LpoA protein
MISKTEQAQQKVETAKTALADMSSSAEARRKAYEEEATRLLVEQEARRKAQKLLEQESQLTTSWDFQNVMLALVEVAAERIVGCCLDKNKYMDDDEDDDDHEKED